MNVQSLFACAVLLATFKAAQAAPSGIADFDEVSAVVESSLKATNVAEISRRQQFWLDEARIVGTTRGEFKIIKPVDFAMPSLTQTRIVSVDTAGQVAAVRLEAVDQSAREFTAFYSLTKRTGNWRIAGMVFDTHESAGDDFQNRVAVQRLLQDYAEGFRSGDGAALRPHWFDHARVIGSLHGSPITRDADGFCQLVTELKAQPDFAALNVSVMQTGSAACARVEIQDWKGTRYTDFLLLYRTSEEFKISQKVFDAHGDR